MSSLREPECMICGARADLVCIRSEVQWDTGVVVCDPWFICQDGDKCRERAGELVPI